MFLFLPSCSAHQLTVRSYGLLKFPLCLTDTIRNYIQSRILSLSTLYDRLQLIYFQVAHILPSLEIAQASLPTDLVA